MITLYSTNCPKCKVLAMKLDQKNIEYEVNTNVDEMLTLGIKSAPNLKFDDGTILNFIDSVKWVNMR